MAAINIFAMSGMIKGRTHTVIAPITPLAVNSEYKPIYHRAPHA